MRFIISEYQSTMPSYRRQFERLAISGEAIAIGENGRKLGRVSHAGGGGMTITLAPENAQTVFAPGARLRVAVEEPSTGIRHNLLVEVKYVRKDEMGVEFVSAG
jgi:hypothetical protein